MIEIFEKFNSVLDPYGEEDWREENDEPMLPKSDWNYNYFENTIFNMVENLPEEFTIKDFINIFNEIPFELRKNDRGYPIELSMNYSHDLNRLSRLLYNLVNKNILKVRYVSKGNVTVPIFRKIVNESKHEIDPYGEEDWEEKTVIKIGDKFISNKYIPSIIKRGEEIEIIGFVNNAIIPDGFKIKIKNKGCWDVGRQAIENSFIKVNESILENNLSDKLFKAFKKGPEETRAFLNSKEGKSKELRKILKKSNSDDDEIKVKNIKISSKKLSPTQNSIDILKAISKPLSDIDLLIKFINKKGKGSIVISDKPESKDYIIIDGHHKWASLHAISPKGKIKAKLIEWPGETTKQKLAAAQISIAATENETPSKSSKESYNLFDMNKKDIINLLTKNINKKISKKRYLLNDDLISELIDNKDNKTKIIYDWAKIDPDETDFDVIRKKIIKKVAENLKKIKSSTKPSKRESMPQFDDADDIIKKLKAGELNMSFIKENKVKRFNNFLYEKSHIEEIDPYNEENWETELNIGTRVTSHGFIYY